MGRRIVKSSSVMEAKGAVRADVAPAEPLGQYWDRLKNLIPAEVSAIYIAGLGVIPKEESLGIVMWAAALVGQLREELGNDLQDALGDRAGCGALVGPPWSVNDLWAYESGNPAWLANSVYAHPNARVIFGSQDAP